jgi:hypothetical protein
LRGAAVQILINEACREREQYDIDDQGNRCERKAHARYWLVVKSRMTMKNSMEW